MATTHISEAEAAWDFAGLMARVRAGEEIVIGSEAQPVVTLRTEPRHGRSAKEILAALEEDTRQRGHSLSMDDDFVADMEEIIRNRRPMDRSAWD